MSVAASLVASCWSAIHEYTRQAGITRAEAVPWASELKFEGVEWCLWIRFPRSAHKSAPVGSVVVACGARLSLSEAEIARMKGLYESDLLPDKTKREKTAVDAELKKEVPTNITTRRDPAGKVAAKWQSRHWTAGQSNDLVKNLGSDLHKAGLSGSATLQTALHITRDAEASGRWHCEERPDPAAKRAADVCDGCNRRGTDSSISGNLRTLSFRQGFVEALRPCSHSERATQYLSYFYWQINERGRVEVPQDKRAAYITEATGKPVSKRTASKQFRELLVDTEILQFAEPHARGIRATSYIPHWPQKWSEGEPLTQQEVEAALDLPRLTPEKLKMLCAPWES